MLMAHCTLYFSVELVSGTITSAFAATDAFPKSVCGSTQPFPLYHPSWIPRNSWDLTESHTPLHFNVSGQHKVSCKIYLIWTPIWSSQVLSVCAPVTFLSRVTLSSAPGLCWGCAPIAAAVQPCDSHRSGAFLERCHWESKGMSQVRARVGKLPLAIHSHCVREKEQEIIHGKKSNPKQRWVLMGGKWTLSNDFFF